MDSCPSSRCSRQGRGRGVGHGDHVSQSGCRGGVRSRPVVRRQIDVPTSSWGRIIGKSGETLRSLQDEFGVRLQVPRPDAPPGSQVSVQGLHEACEGCERRILELVQEMSRRPEKAAPEKAAGRRTGAAKPPQRSAWPPACSLCKNQIRSEKQAFDHLGSVRHFAAMRELLSDALPADCPLGADNILGVAALLADEGVRQAHEELGFDVDGLLGMVPMLEQRRLVARALQEDISRQPASSNWLRVEQRWRSAWDETPHESGKTLHILEAPPLDEMATRCLPDESPPLVREIGLPAPLPKADPRGRKQRALRGEHRFPFEPSSRLGVVVLLQRGLAADEFDLVCGTSLIKALSGDGNCCKDSYYLQRLGGSGGAWCCLHVPARFHSQDDAGHAVEKLLCGVDSKRPRSFYCSSKMRIGDRCVLVTSEVDARDETNDLVEIKSSGSNRGAGIISATTALQVACNGSGVLLCCALDAGKTRLLDVQRVSAAEAKEMHKAAFISCGQRVSFMLERLYSHELLQSPGSTPDGHNFVVELRFDDNKEPMLEPASSSMRVLPTGLPTL